MTRRIPIAEIACAVIVALSFAPWPANGARPYESPHEETVTLNAHQTLKACRQALRERPGLCDLVKFGGGEQVESARLDIDGDGDTDLIVRQLGLFACGAHNCPTPVFLFEHGRLREAEPSISAAGPIWICRTGERQGLRMVSGGPCFIFTVRQRE